MIEAALENLRANLPSAVSPVQQCRPHSHVLHVAASGPSLADTLGELGGYIGAVNDSYQYLIDQGIIPNALCIVDPRDLSDKIEPRPDVHYYIASQAHPKVFEKLKGCHVRIFHCLPTCEGLVDGLMIGGGTTVGLRWIHLGWILGFREIHLHGMDSSYRDGNEYFNGSSQKDCITFGGFRTNRQLLRQVDDFFKVKEMLPDVKIELHGDGLLQCTVRNTGLGIAS